MPDSDIVITGLGVVSAIGIGREAFWQNVLARQTGIRCLNEREDDGATPSAEQQDDPFWWGAPILDFDPKQYVRPRKALKVMCREIQTAFAASDLATRDAGLEDQLPATTDGLVAPDRIGTVFGSEMFYGPPQEMVQAFRGCLRDDGTVDESRFGGAAMKGIMPLWMLKYLPNMPACHVGISVNALGPNNSLVLGDTSGPAALMESVSCLRRGHADIMISGATGTRINTTRLNYRHDYPVVQTLDSGNECNPGKSGVIGGEGSAVVILETANHATQRSAIQLARWLGHASRFVPAQGIRTRQRNAALDGSSNRGSENAVKLAIQASLETANLVPDDIAFVVSHAMGDPSMDECESNAIQSTLGSVPILRPMTWLAHTGAASGAFALAAAVCGLQDLDAHRAGDLVIPWEFNHQARDLDEPRIASKGRACMCLCHGSEGAATAIVLGLP